MRLVSSSGSNTSTVMSTGKSRATAVVPVSAISGGKPITLSGVRSQQQTVKMVPIAPATPAIRTVRITNLLFCYFNACLVLCVSASIYRAFWYLEIH